MKVSAHCATDDFGIPEVNGPWKRDGRADTERGRSAEDRADVSGILHGIEHEETVVAIYRQRVERSRRHFGNREHSLRRLRLGGARELLRGDFSKLDVAAPEGALQISTSGYIS